MTVQNLDVNKSNNKEDISSESWKYRLSMCVQKIRCCASISHTVLSEKKKFAQKDCNWGGNVASSLYFAHKEAVNDVEIKYWVDTEEIKMYYWANKMISIIFRNIKGTIYRSTTLHKIDERVNEDPNATRTQLLKPFIYLLLRKSNFSLLERVF